MSEYQVRIRGEEREDDGLSIEMGSTRAGKAWWEIPLPQCPDCGGDLVWYEAGYVPGTRACKGEPVGGRASNILDVRVPQPRQYEDYRVPAEIAGQADALLRERNTCSDARVEEIDAGLLAMLRPWTRSTYAEDGGCGSLFSVQAADGGRVFLRRERFYA